MLVVSRKKEERILVGEQIVVTILAIDGGQVKVGIQAPADVRIVRAEIQERQQAAGADQVVTLRAPDEAAIALGRALV